MNLRINLVHWYSNYILPRAFGNSRGREGCGLRLASFRTASTRVFALIQFKISFEKRLLCQRKNLERHCRGNQLVSGQARRKPRHSKMYEILKFFLNIKENRVPIMIQISDSCVLYCYCRISI